MEADRGSLPRLGAERGGGAGDAGASLQDVGNDVGLRGDGFVGEDVEDFRQRDAGQFGLAPFQQALGERIHEGYESVRVDGDHSGVHVVEELAQAARPFDDGPVVPMQPQRGVDREPQVPFVDRPEHVSKGQRRRRAPRECAAGAVGEEEYRYVEALHVLGDLDAVESVAGGEAHQNDVRICLHGPGDGLAWRRNGGTHRVAQAREAFGGVLGERLGGFDDQHGDVFHGVPA